MDASISSRRERTAHRTALHSGERSLASALAQTGVITYARRERTPLPLARPHERSGAPVAMVLVVGLVVLLARSANAAPTVVPDKARQLADRGRTSHEAGDYNTAIAAYTEAYALAPSPALLFNLAQAYRLRGNCDDAVLMYRRYLDTTPAPDARVIAAGHLVTVERCAHEVSLTIPIAAGERAGVSATVVTRPVVRATPGELRQQIGLGLVIGGGLSLAAAAYFALDAHSAEADVEAGYQVGGRGRDIASLDARGERSATLATWLGLGGGALVVGGGATYFLGWRAERALPIVVVPARGGAKASVAWRF